MKGQGKWEFDSLSQYRRVLLLLHNQYKVSTPLHYMVLLKAVDAVFRRVPDKGVGVVLSDLTEIRPIACLVSLIFFFFIHSFYKILIHYVYKQKQLESFI